MYILTLTKKVKTVYAIDEYSYVEYWAYPPCHAFFPSHNMLQLGVQYTHTLSQKSAGTLFSQLINEIN